MTQAVPRHTRVSGRLLLHVVYFLKHLIGGGDARALAEEARWYALYAQGHGKCCATPSDPRPRLQRPRHPHDHHTHVRVSTQAAFQRHQPRVSRACGILPHRLSSVLALRRGFEQPIDLVDGLSQGFQPGVEQGQYVDARPGTVVVTHAFDQLEKKIGALQTAPDRDHALSRAIAPPADSPLFMGLHFT